MIARLRDGCHTHAPSSGFYIMPLRIHKKHFKLVQRRDILNFFAKNMFLKKIFQLAIKCVPESHIRIMVTLLLLLLPQWLGETVTSFNSFINCVISSLPVYFTKENKNVKTVKQKAPMWED